MLKYVFYLCVLLLSIGQFSAIYKSGDSSVYLFDIVIGLFSVVGILYFLIKKQVSLPKPFLFFLGFTAIAAISLLVRFELYELMEVVTSGFYLVRWAVYLTAALVLYNMLSQKLISCDQVVGAFIISGVFVSIAGFIQLVVLPDFTVLDPTLGWDPHKNRLASTFFDPNFTGAYLVICFILLFEHNKRSPWIWVLLAAVFLTFSRSSWGMLALAILVYGVFKYRWLLVLSLLVAFSTYFFVPRVQTRLSGVTDPADSATLRLVSWGNAWEICRDNLVLGVGFNTYRYVQRDYGFLTPDSVDIHSGAGADSSLLFVLATTGIFGLVMFVLGFTYMRGVMLSAVFAGLLLHSQFVNSLFYPPILFLWLILITGFSCSLRTSR